MCPEALGTISSRKKLHFLREKSSHKNKNVLLTLTRVWTQKQEGNRELNIRNINFTYVNVWAWSYCLYVIYYVWLDFQNKASFGQSQFDEVEAPKTSWLGSGKDRILGWTNFVHFCNLSGVNYVTYLGLFSLFLSNFAAFSRWEWAACQT